MKEIEIITKTNNDIAASIYHSESIENPVLIIASATGVKQSVYKKFASFIASKGITVITFDYQGIGRSLKGKLGDIQVNTQEWGSIDLENVIQYALENYPNSKKYILGHSIGGQLVGFAASAVKIDKIILVAAQSGYWKYWSGIGRIKMWLTWHLVLPLFTNIFGYMPSKRISGMENLPKNVAIQWSNWGKKSDYLFSDILSTQSFFDKIESPMTAISIEADQFAPQSAVEWMASKYNNVQLKKIHLKAHDYNTKKIGHFGIFREKFQANLWELLFNELD